MLILILGAKRKIPKREIVCFGTILDIQLNFKVIKWRFHWGWNAAAGPCKIGVYLCSKYFTLPKNLFLILIFCYRTLKFMKSCNKYFKKDILILGSYTRFSELKITIPPFHPLYPIPSPSTGWMNWPINQLASIDENFSPVIISTYIVHPFIFII